MAGPGLKVVQIFLSPPLISHRLVQVKYIFGLLYLKVIQQHFSLLKGF